MSQYVRYRGYLKEVDNPNRLSLEELCKELCMMKNFKRESYHADWTHCLCMEDYQKYVVLDGELFEIQELKEIDFDEFYCNITKQDDGRYFFETQYYDGCTYLQEMIEENWSDSE